MTSAHKLGWAALPAALAFVLALIGCGTPGAPMPPSLKLPDPVTNLAAVRTGNQVSLTWTMPKKNTDKLLLKSNVPARVCRKEEAGACTPVPANLQFAPGAAAAFAETLPDALAAGSPRALTYYVELTNHNGRSAGLSNGAVVLAGEAPAPLANLTAEVRKDGIALRWTPDSPAMQPSARAAVRFQRKLLTPQSEAQPKPQNGILAPAPEPLERNLLVESSALGRALDKEIRFGETYEYCAQRVARVTVDGQTFELAGPVSAPVRVEALDIFPPETPAGLAAVFTADAGTGTAIDLSWQPNTEADLAGYAVYRREGAGNWQRISPAQPVVGPAFHDAQVQLGHAYRYAVTAIGQRGHESARSAEAEETVPNP